MNPKYKGIIFDINGVLEYQGKVYPQAIELIRYLRNKGILLRVLSNSTLRSQKGCANKLNALGFDFQEKEMITASYATANYLKTLSPGACWIMLEGEGLNEFKDIRLSQKDPEYIVVGDYRDGFNFQNLNKALQFLLKGSKLIAMIPEMVDSSFKETELTVGAYARMLELASGQEAVYIGKPSRYAFDMCLQTMPIPKSQVIMVGDRLHTDILGAKNSGLDSILLKTGEFKASDLKEELQPTYCFDSIAELANLF
jgi:NagD protein